MFLLRLALAFSFVYVGIASFTNPDLWAGFVPPFVSNIISFDIFLKLHGAFQIFLGLWLLFGRYRFTAGIIAAVLLFGIALFHLSAWDIVFRDVSLGLASLAYAFSGKKNHIAE